MVREHDLKILPEYFKAIKDGIKTFEIRRDDRGYRVGDILILKEYGNRRYTGSTIRALITYITSYAQKENYVVMSIRLVEQL